jgi:hypothetical protein
MSTLTLTLTRILIVLSLTVTLRGSAPDRTSASAARAPQTARTSASRFVDDVEGCREQPATQPVVPAACEVR